MAALGVSSSERPKSSLGLDEIELDTFHGRIMRVLGRFAIGTTALKVWKTRSTRGKLRAEIMPAHYDARAERGARGPVGVVELRDAKGYWMHWGETWTVDPLPAPKKKQPCELFLPEQLSLALFCGERYDPVKRQLFRAEWDHFEDGLGAERTPQPHWNVDHRVPHPAVDETRDLSRSGGGIAISPIPGVELAETQAIEGVELPHPEGTDISQHHLGMRLRWEGKNPSWRSPFETQFAQQVTKWLEACLISITSELKAQIRKGSARGW